MLFNAASLLVLAAVARAIQITAPTNTTGWVAGVPQTITWESVSTDPKEFEIKLQVPNSAKIQTITVADKVDTSAGSYTFTPTSEEIGDQYRVSFYNTDSNNGILAQSDYFAIEQCTGSDCSSAGASASAASGSAAATGSASASKTSASAGATASAPSGASVSPVAPSSTVSGNAFASITPTGNGAAALVPSLALVGGSLIAFML